MRGPEPVNIRELQEDLSNKRSIMNGARIRLEENDPKIDIENVRMRERDYQEALLILESLPSPPVLPHRGNLTFISGTLESIERIRCRTDFDIDFYANNPLPELSGGQRLAGGAAAMAAGSPALGALLASDNDKPVLSNADHIEGRINGQPFRGWVGMTDLKAGDEVKMAAEWQDDHWQVYAVMLPAERIISVCPRCDRGRKAYAWFRFKIFIGWVIGMMTLLILLQAQVQETDFISGLRAVLDLNGLYKPWFWAAMLTVFSVFWGLIGYFDYDASSKTNCRLAEDIFFVLGWEKPAWGNLNRSTARHEAALRREGKWYPPGRKDKPLRPTAQWAGAYEYWYYY